ncbi:MAG TPA: A24 family peptidase C-terminal domain-containing protein [Acidobacteriota bacterium]|nr:A24 family peptidase C-terminal domain-containing protein [Acidobacteriota bacterium]
MQTILAAAKVTLSLAFLLYASWSDYKTREVSNRVWAFYAPLALFLSLVDLLLYKSSDWLFFVLSIGFTIVLALGLFYSGGFGGADSKALMCIALALPFFPETLFTPIFAAGVSPLAKNLFPLTIFSNAVLFAAASGIYMLLRNLIWRITTGKKIFEGTLGTESIGKKILVMITGYKVSVAKLKEKWHVYPMEDVEEENGENPLKRKLVVVPKDEHRDEIVERLSKAVDAGKIDAYVWATPGLPMLIFITIGLIVALLFGDIVWLLVSFVLG